MPKRITLSDSPALRMAKEKAATQFVITKQVLNEGLCKSAIGSFSLPSFLRSSLKRSKKSR